MNFYPMLFSPPMVTAILNGSKTMTRRALKVKGCKPFTPLNTWDLDSINYWNIDYFPYGKVGDVLYVKETFYALGKWVKNGTTKIGKQKFKFQYAKTLTGPCILFNTPQTVSTKKDGVARWYKRPSLFMEKIFARLFLEITAIRCEHLKDISEADAAAEGVEKGSAYDHLYNIDLATHRDYLTGQMKWIKAKLSFKTLWQKINGKESWDANPWVWVIEFKRIEKPNNFLS